MPEIHLPAAYAAGGGDWGLRHNNPGNLGISPSLPVSDRRVYATPEDGVAAIGYQLDNYAARGINTVAGMVSQWAPPTENDTPTLIARAAHYLGVDPNQPINLSDPAVRRKMVEATILNEHGGVIPAGYEREVIDGAMQKGPPTPIKLDTGQVTAGDTPAAQERFRQGQARTEELRGMLGKLVEQMNKTDPNDPEIRDLLRRHREKSEQYEQALLDHEMHPPQRTERDLFQSMGSLAMIAAAIGGSFARVPAIASLNAAGAALEAQNTGDERAYQDHMEVWKAQNAALQHALTFEGNQITDIMEDRRASLAEKHDRLRDALQVAGLDEKIIELEQGNYDALGKYAKQTLDMAETQARIGKLHAETEEAEAKIKARQDWSGLDPEKDRAIIRSLNAEAARLTKQAAADAEKSGQPAPTPITGQQLAKDPIEVQKASMKEKASGWGNYEFIDPDTGKKKEQYGYVEPGVGLLDEHGTVIPTQSGSLRGVSRTSQQPLDPYTGPPTWPGAPDTPPPGDPDISDPSVWTQAVAWAASGKDPVGLSRNAPQAQAIRKALPVALAALGISNSDFYKQRIKYQTELVRNESIERSFGSGMNGRNLISLNTVADHIALFRQYAEALKTHDLIRVNQLQQRLAVEGGGAEVINYALAARITGDEVVRLLTTTGGTITDREDIAKRLAAYSSPEQFEGAANTLTNYVRGRYAPLRVAYARNDPEKERYFNEHMMTPEARALFEGPALPPIVETRGTGSPPSPARPSWVDPGFTGPPAMIGDRPIYPGEDHKWHFGDDHSLVPGQ